MEPSYTVGGNAIVQPLWRTVWRFLKKLEIKLPYDPATPLLGIYTAAAAAKPRQSCPTLWDPIEGSPPGSHPWDSPGKNTGVGCHFLLQCMKMKSESEVTQSYPTLCDPMDSSPPGSSVHGISQARVLEWVAIAFSDTHWGNQNWKRHVYPNVHCSTVCNN